jgi:hypothetical protein
MGNEVNMNILNKDGSISDLILEENFSKLNINNKINILLKALLIERNKNNESIVKF